jgi:trk system potassium uptake protein TrkA
LGNFGHYLAIQLYKKGHEVLAIDKKASLVSEIKDRVSQAVIADATDRKAMEALGLDKMDACVVCIGSVLSESILATLTMKDLGLERLYAKAISKVHSRILYKIGASEVFFPEKDQATSLAERLHNPNMLEYFPFMEGYSIVEIRPPKKFIGKSLKELDLINRFGVQVIAIKERDSDNHNLMPTALTVLKDNHIIILLGPDDSLDRL